MSHPRIEFYFDFISPYAYLAARRIEGVAERLAAPLCAVPVLFAGLLNHFGHVGPAEIETKRRWAFKQALRRGRRLGIPVVPPPHHPFNPLLALRVATAAAEPVRFRVVHALFSAAWETGQGVERESDVRQALAALHAAGVVDAEVLLASAVTPEVKAELREATELAITRGVFGVPSFIVGEELYWGEDTLDDLVNEYPNPGGPDAVLVQRWLELKPSATRRH